MSATLGHLNIQLTLDQINFQRNLEKSSQETQRFTRQFQINFANAQRKAKQFSERTTQYLNNIEKAANSINNTARWQVGLNLSSELMRGVKSTLAYAETNTELANRLRLVTDNSNELIVATEAVFDISLRTNQAVSATSEVYQRFAKNADQLGISQLEVAELTETVSKAVAMSGASAASSQAALMQFGQALASGELRGAELNSVMEQTPGLAEAIAKGLGVTIGELRAMGKAGELNIPKVIDALKNAKSAVDTDFEKRVKTVSQAFTNLETQMVKTIGEMDQGFGVTQKLAQGIELAADNLDIFIKVASAFAALGVTHLVGGYANKKLESAINTAKSVREHQNETKAILGTIQAKRLEAQADLALLNEQYKLAQSERTRFALREQMKAQTQQIIALAQQEAQAKRNLITVNSLASKAGGLLKNALGLIGGPTGAAMLAGSALWYFVEQAKQAHDQALDTAGANEKLKQSYDGLSESALTKIIYQQIEDLANFDKQLAKTQAEISTIQTSHWQFGLELSDKSKQDIDKLKADLDEIGNNKTKNIQALEKQLVALGTAFLNNGKSVDDFKAKLKLFGVDAKTAESVIAKLPTSVDKTGDSVKQAEQKTLDLADAIKKLNEKSTSLAQKLEVAKLKQQGQAKTAYVLAGLYELLGKEGAEYNQVLIDIANGTINAANAADKAVGLSVETLNKLFAGKETLGKMFETENQTETIETNLKTSSKGESTRENWLKFYDDLRQKSGSTLNEIKIEEDQMFKRLDEYRKKGVVSHQEAMSAKLAIEKKFAQQRLELAGKYAPNKLAKFNFDKEIAAVRELQAANQLTIQEAEQASLKLQFDYAQQIAQNAVDPLSQLKAMYDPNQAILNQQAQELALLQSFNEQKLITEEEYQQRKQEIINRYKNDEFQRDMNNYATGLNDLGGAFGSLASMVEQSAGKQSSAYKAMFAVSKAFAIAEATVKLSQAVAQAMASPDSLTPAQKFANMAAVAAAGVNVISQITSVGFDTGGFTGLGGKYTPAGIVHKGEYVLTKEATSRIGLDYLNYLNYGNAFRGRGFANGGAVGSVNSLASGYSHIGNRAPNVSVKVINNGEPMQADVSTKQRGNELEITVALLNEMRKIAKAEANDTIQQNFRSGGVFA